MGKAKKYELHDLLMPVLTLRLQPKDILVLKTARPILARERVQINDLLQAHLGFRVIVLCLDVNDDLAVIRYEDAAKAADGN